MMVRYKQPAWGVLVRAPEADVREILARYEEHMLYRTNGEWTAGFYMDQTADCRDRRAGNLLADEDYEPVYRFEFSDRGFVTKRWNGGGWDILFSEPEEPAEEWAETDWVQPEDILHGVGIVPPYEDPDVPPPPPLRPVQRRRAMIVEGSSVEQVRALAPEGLQIEPGPHGAIIYNPDLETRFAFWKLGRVIEVDFIIDDGFFQVSYVQDEEDFGVFRAGYTQPWDSTPFLPNIEGATDPGDIVDKLGIPRWFLDRATSSS